MITAVELNKLSIKDKIILLEKIWSSLKQEGDNIESPKWHGDVLAERRRKIETGEVELLTIDDLKKSKKCKRSRCSYFGYAAKSIKNSFKALFQEIVF